MTEYKGRDFLLKLGTWGGGTTIAGCRTHSLQVSNSEVDITNKSSGGYRTLLEGAGTKSVTINASGVVTGETGYETLQNACFNATIDSYAMGWADGDTLSGSFQVTAFTLDGAQDGAQEFSVTLASSGAYTFTAA